MGGTSTQKQTSDSTGTSTNSLAGTQAQNSTTAPWLASQPALQGILGQLQGNLGNTGLTGAENNAFNTTEANANNYSGTVAPQISNYAQTLLNGGGANGQAGNINQNYQNYAAQTNPLASNTDYNPYNTPGFKDAISTMSSDITNGVNGQFAAAGRDFSGANQMALSRGLSQGLAPTIAAQYNQNVQNQQGAAGNLYGAGNTNAGLLSGLQQQFLANQGQGVTAAGQGLDAQNAGANAALQAEAARRGVPVQALGLLAQIGIPIAGLGSQNSGTSNTTGTNTGTTTSNGTQTGENTMSGAQQFGAIAGGLGSLFSGIGNAGVGLAKFSDRRLKEDIKQVGALFDGTPVYRYRYLGQPRTEIGLMAQDVERYAPEAVQELHGFKAVDYKLATEQAVEVGGR